MTRQTAAWIFFCVVVVLIAVSFRLAGLELKAVHHDESVNYAFTKKLLEKGEYAYNPTAYHGPFLYFIGVPAVALGGFSKTTLRVTPAIFGILAVVFVLLLHPYLGKPGALFAAAVLALSPADVYFSKTFIHEIYFAFACAGMFWAFFAASRTGKAVPVVAFWLFLTLSFTIKETAAFGVVAFGAAMIVAWIANITAKEENRFYCGPIVGHPDALYLLWAVGISLTVWTLLFSSFLTHPRGIPDFFQAYISWFDTGVKEKPHAKPWSYFFVMVGKYYLPALPFALWAAIRGFWKKRPHTLALLTIAVVVHGIYSIIPYKTPWCVLVIGLAWIVLAADGFTDLWQMAKFPALRISFALLVISGLFAYGLASYKLNFERYDDDEGYSIVYVQTLRDYEKMPADLERIALASGLGDDLPVYITAKAKNPTRFYLRNYRHRKQENNKLPEKFTQPVIVTRSIEYEDVEERLTQPYHMETYPVFPGWWIYLLVEEELWQKAEAAELAK